MRAQTIPYALLLRHWEPSADIEPLLNGFDDAQAISRIEVALESFGLDVIRARYEAEGRDASVYFYEEFLRAYDPASSRGRGVLYTPPEVVEFIVRGLSTLLQDKFGLSLGDALVIDPCCGLGTFLRHIERSTEHPVQAIGMELMPAPCAIAQCLLPETRVVLADWLSHTNLETSGRLPVIVGNPPYSGHSSNAGKIADLMADYRHGLNERNPKWLQDDYVKFIRMAQQHIDSANRGIVAFITNHSYLFNPTFRAMRESLSRTFDEILVLDLGGNVKQLDTANENVFPIKMGVAISFMIRATGSAGCTIRHAEIRGTRQEKLTALKETELGEMPWLDVPPSGTFHLFTPHDTDLREEFYSFPSLFDIFTQSTIGFVTSRDAFAIGFSRDEVMARIGALRSGKVSDQALRENYRVGDLDIDLARRSLQEDPNWEDGIREILYRPFDRRWTYYSRTIMERPRLPFMENLMRENIALAIGRAGQVIGSDEWDVVFCTDRPADLNLFRRGGAKLFPRYVYHDGERLSNLHTDAFDEDMLFGYIYAILHSRAYRQRYNELLRVDYPRIPIPQDHDLLSRLAEAGMELIEAHLLRATTPFASSSTGQVSALRIGGYEIPAKCLKDREHVDREVDLAMITSAVERTSFLRGQIDNIVSQCPPWQHT